MSVLTYFNFPISFKLQGGNYPFNSFKGKLCSGQGLYNSIYARKEMSAHMALLACTFLYSFFLTYFAYKTYNLLKEIGPKGSLGLINGKFR